MTQAVRDTALVPVAAPQPELLTVALPTFEMYGRGAEFLDFSLRQIADQSYAHFEILVSDNSKDQCVAEVCTAWSARGLPIRYVYNPESLVNSSIAVNNAIKHARGEYIKILFQDDFLLGRHALRRTVEAFQKYPQRNWLVSACAHSKDGHRIVHPFYPRYHSQIHLGKNTISSPSVLSLRNKDKIYFDERLVWLMDVEYYKRLFETFGEPILLNEVTAVNRLWELQLSNTVSAERKEHEWQLVQARHGSTLSAGTAEDDGIAGAPPPAAAGAWYSEAYTVEQFFDDLCCLRFDPELCRSRGVVDLNEHLPVLRRYASQCAHVTELGLRFGVSTHAFLIAKPQKVVSLELNYHYFSNFDHEVRKFAEDCGTEFELLIGDSLTLSIEETDLLFIDTLHTYAQLSRELCAHQASVRKWIILHDTELFGTSDEELYRCGATSAEIEAASSTASGLRPAIAEFISAHPQWRLKEHYENNNGLTVLERVPEPLPESASGVSVVVCTRNGASRLPDTLRALAMQETPPGLPWEVLLVDNNSQDETVDLARRIWAEHDCEAPLRILQETREGVAYARQAGVSAARFEYIIFCDDDNRLAADYLKVAYQTVETQPEVGALGGQSTAEADVPFPDWFPGYAFGYAIGTQAEKSGDVSSRGFVWGAGMCTRRSLLRRFQERGYQPLLSGRRGEELLAGDDSELCRWILLEGYALWYEERLRFKHFIAPERLTEEYREGIFQGFALSQPVLLAYDQALADRANRRSPLLSYGIGLVHLLRALSAGQSMRPLHLARAQLRLGPRLRLTRPLFDVLKMLDKRP